MASVRRHSRHTRWARPLVALRSLLIPSLMLSAGAASADPLYVNQAVVGGSQDGSNWENAFIDLQDALTVALPGDEIWVAAGTYVPSLQSDPPDARSATFTLPSGVAIYGGFAGSESSRGERDPNANVCLLDGFTGSANVYHVVTAISTAAGTVLDGFQIANGLANGSTSATAEAAGINAKSAVLELRNLVMFGNNAPGGTSNGHGGAIRIQAGTVTIHDSRFLVNSARFGGAIDAGAGATVEIVRAVFAGNDATFAGGGALYVGGANVRVVDSLFLENSGNNQGGAIFGSFASIRVEGSRFWGNVTRAAGGAIYVFQSSNLVAVNSAFVGNAATVEAGGSGGAIQLADSATGVLTNCTFGYNVADQNGGGIAAFDSSQVTVQNSILFGNTDGLNGGTASAQQIYLDPGTTPVAAVSYSLVEGGFTGTGNINDNPIFFALPDPGDGSWETPGDNNYSDVRVQDESPAFDAGNNLADLDGPGPAVLTIADMPTDLDGNPRLLDDPRTPDTGSGTAPIVDMGAFEFVLFVDGFEFGDTSRWSATVP